MSLFILSLPIIFFNGSVLIAGANEPYKYADDELVIKIDDVSLPSEVVVEVINNRTIVPLRVISEDLGARVEWSNSSITITKSGTPVILKLYSKTAIKNDQRVLLDVEPYLKNNQVMVPLRFLSETFGCNVSYKDAKVTIATSPLFINGVKVKVTQYEYHMTMGGVISQIKGNAYNKNIYDAFIKNIGRKTDAPASYSWRYNIDTIGAYYKNAQYDFMDQNGKSIQRFDIYSLVESFPKELLSKYPKVLLYDASANQWYLFKYTTPQSIDQIINTAEKNGFLKVISNTVV